MKNTALSLMLKSLPRHVIIFVCAFQASEAAINLVIREVGADVVVSASGSYDTWQSPITLSVVASSSTYEATFLESVPFSEALVSLGSGDFASVVELSGFGPLTGLPFPTQTPAGAVATGDIFGFDLPYNLAGMRFWAPVGYSAGDPIAGSLFLPNTTFADLGAVVGSSGVIDFISVGGPDNYTWEVVPEPSSWGVWVGLSSLAFVIVRRRARVAVV